MRRSLVVLALTGLVSAGVIGSGAAAAATKKPFCAAVADFSRTLVIDPQDTNAQEARKVAKRFTNAAKQTDAPKKAAKALTTIGDFFGRLADAANAGAKARVAARYGTAYGAAVTTFGTQYAAECGGAATGSSGSGSAASAGGGTVTGSLNGRISSAPIDSCTITDTNGLIRSSDGAFELTWANDVYRLVWTAGGSTYTGVVGGTIVGKTVTFNGSAGGVPVSGAAMCP